MWFEVAWPKRGRDLPSSSIPLVRGSRMVGKRERIRANDGASRTTTRAHFVRVPGTSDVRPAALWDACACFVLAHERDLVRSVRTPQYDDHRRVVFSFSNFKGNQTIFRRSLPTDSDRSGHVRFVTPSPANLRFHCQ